MISRAIHVALRRVRAHLSYAGVVATVALFLVLGGSAYAAVRLANNSVTRRTIAPRAVNGSKLANSAITSTKVKDHSLLARDFKAGQIPAAARGAQGDKGATGPQGPTGATGPSGAMGPTGATGAAGASGLSTGPAGGDLAGTFPNPSIKDGAVTGAKLGLPLSLSGTLTAPFLSITGDNTGSVPEAMLYVSQTGSNTTGPSIYGETQSQFANTGTAGVMGVSTGTGGYAMQASAKNPAGNQAALIATSAGNGDGIVADSAGGTGVEGSTQSGGSNAGVYGFSPAFVNAGTGVKASAFGTNSVGLRATGTGTASKAAIFTGDVDIVGTLTKSAGTFKIDNPVDPANESLSHSFVESPDMKNIYDGVVTTDGDGFATVTMPDWFDALNAHFRYQLTVLGHSFARAIVWEELTGESFRIRTDEPATRVSWQITGIREDAYARAHRTPVVEQKTGADRGRYLTPELFGQPRSRAIGAEG